MYQYSLYKDFDFKTSIYISIPQNINANINYSKNDDYNIKSIYNQEYVDLFLKKLDKTDLKVFINNENDYIINFNGEENNTLRLILYVYTYKQEKQMYKETIKLNTTKKLSNITNGEYIKLVLRVYGNGIGKLKNISIKSKKNIRNITNKEIFELGYNNPSTINNLKIACILDKFTMNCYEKMCKLIKITPDNWKIDLELNRPNLLFVESAWYGNDNAWENKVQCKKEYDRTILNDVIKWCNENKITTVFWNKEDPFHYNHFIDSAKLFDYIFTTDENCIKKYKKDLNNKNVYLLQFAAQPKIHNPIKIYDNRIDKACFAGSFYNNKYIERKESLETLLKVASENIGLDIYDRNYNNPNIQYKFPEKFNKYVKGYLEPHDLDKCNKGYKVMLNTNSIINSPTMFSRRVFEGLACATPVVSTYSKGIENIFENLVVSSDYEEELKKEILNLKEEYYYNKKSILGVREIMNKHTYEHRLKFILDKIGIKIVPKEKYICIICKINNIEEFKDVISIYEKQTYKYKQICIIVKSKQLYEALKNKNNNICLILINNNNLNKSLKEYVMCDYISFINLDNYYFENYLEDMINATLYTDAQVIGKKSFFKSINNDNINLVNEGFEYQYVYNLDLDKCIIKSNIIYMEDMSKILEYIKINCMDKFRFGIRYFSIDKYNFIEALSCIDNLTENIYKI